MYTGGVSSLAEQIANQLQAKDDPRPLLEKRDLVRNMGVVVLVYITETAHGTCRTGYRQLLVIKVHTS